MNEFPYPLILYEKALMPHDWPRMFYETAELGFQGLELSVDESDARLARLDWSDRTCLCVARAAKEAGVRLQSLCFSGQRRFPMGSEEPDLVKTSLKLMEKCILLCQNLGIRTLQVAGFDVYYEPSTPQTYLRYTDNLEKMTRLAERHGVMLAIEPVEKGVLSVRMALRIVNRIRSPFLQIYPDIANMAALGIDYAPQLEAGTGHIVQLHIRDALPGFYYGVEMGTGIIDFADAFRLFARLGLSCPLTLEMWAEHEETYFDAVRRAAAYLRRAEAASRLPLSGISAKEKELSKQEKG